MCFIFSSPTKQEEIPLSNPHEYILNFLIFSEQAAWGKPKYKWIFRKRSCKHRTLLSEISLIFTWELSPLSINHLFTTTFLQSCSGRKPAFFKPIPNGKRVTLTFVLISGLVLCTRVGSKFQIDAHASRSFTRPTQKTVTYAWITV